MAFSRVLNLTTRRFLSLTTRVDAKVTVVGANGGIGSPLSLLLKHSPYITDLSLHDVTSCEGNAHDLSHIDTAAEINFATGLDKLLLVAENSDIIVITAGIPRKPGMSRNDLYETNAKIMFDIMKELSNLKNYPFFAIVSNPVNSLVPLAAEILKKRGTFDQNRICGITTLDIIRANTFYSQVVSCDPREAHVPVVGGHEGSTIVPLFSMAQPEAKLDSVEIDRLVERVQNAGTEVVKAKGGHGSATLSMAYAANHFVTSLLQARLGKESIVECCYAFTRTFGTDGVFFAEPRVLGVDGLKQTLPYDKVTPKEIALIDKAKEDIAVLIKKAKGFPLLSSL